MKKNCDLVVHVEYDQGAGCPMTEQDGQWTLKSFLRDSIHHVAYEKVFPNGKPSIGLWRKLSVGLAFRLDYFEHGLGAYSLAGEGAQCRWDTSPGAGILLWEHPPREMGAKTREERARDARLFLETYNNWMNGQVYGYTIEMPSGGHLDSCWGFYDKEGLVESLCEALEGHVVPGDQIELRGDAADLLDAADFPTGVELTRGRKH